MVVGSTGSAPRQNRGQAVPPAKRSFSLGARLGGARIFPRAARQGLHRIELIQYATREMPLSKQGRLMPNRNSPQISSDKALLDAMMRCQRAAGYVPSSHWKSYESATLAALHSVDLNNFLTVPNPFGSFFASRLRRPNLLRRIGYRLRKEFSRLVGLAEPPSPLGPIVEASCQERMNFMAQEFAEAIYNFDYGHCLLEVEDFSPVIRQRFSRLQIANIPSSSCTTSPARNGCYDIWSCQRGPVLWKSVQASADLLKFCARFGLILESRWST